MHKRPKILIFINCLKMGGAERVVSHLINYLKDDLDIHLALYTSEIDYPIPPETKLFDLRQTENGSNFLKFLKLPLMSYRLYRYCKKNEISTLVSFLNRPCYINGLVKALWGYKGRVIMCERSHQSTMIGRHSRFYRFIARNLLLFSYNRADMVLVNSYSSQQDLVTNFKLRRPTRVIYNPVNLDIITKQSNESVPFEIDPNSFYFISVGGFRKEKNHSLLLEAFYLIRDLPVKLILVGDGAQKESILKKIELLELGDKIILTGFDVNPYKYIVNSQCLVLSSHVEGFPNVLLEALACGRSVISTDCPSGPREILAPETDLHHAATSHYEIAEYGILTPVDDAAILADALRRIYLDNNLRKSFEKKAQARAAQFDIIQITRQFRIAFSD